MTEEPTSVSRVKVRLRNILLAQAWVAVWLGLIVVARQDPWLTTVPPISRLNWVVVVGIVLLPFAAVGTLFGRPVRGLLVGVVLIAVAWFFASGFHPG